MQASIPKKYAPTLNSDLTCKQDAANLLPMNTTNKTRRMVCSTTNPSGYQEIDPVTREPMNTETHQTGEGNAPREDDAEVYSRAYIGARGRVHELEAQRDELLAAAKNAAAKWECSMGNEAAIAFADLKAAIAKVEGV